MIHDTISNGQDVYCRRCCRSWGIDEVMPEVCQKPEPQTSGKLRAYLIGPANFGTNPAMVYAWSPSEAKYVGQVMTGIHADDLTVQPIPLLDVRCRAADSCPTFNPKDLATAYATYAKDIVNWFPGATDVVSLLKLTKKATR
ncbi:hypothetical protein AVP3_0047 [Aeromonas phage AVP3]|nr:hypothetical protein [Aeromonas phage BUCT552]